jgi:predicted metal-dependent hydrolase
MPALTETFTAVPAALLKCSNESAHDCVPVNSTKADNATPPTDIIPRKFKGSFPGDIPRYWFRQNPVLTSMLNTYTLLVPDNEHYYMRNIRRAYERLESPELKARVQNFIQQEGQHGVAHKRYWTNLAAQGLRFNGFLRFTNFLSYKLLEPMFPLSVQLSVIAAVEHINAYMGHIFLEGDLLKDADPRKRNLFSWHFAEEIEHKAVCYDVLQEVSTSYLLRVAGMLLAAPLFYAFSLIGTVYFSSQWRALLSMRSWGDWFRFQFTREKVAFKSLRYLLLYFKPRFHPGQIPDYPLAEAFLNSDAFHAASGTGEGAP